MSNTNDRAPRKPLSQAHRFKISQALMGNKNGRGRPKDPPPHPEETARTEGRA